MSEHLAAGEVHVWTVRLAASATQVRDLRDCLSPEEIRRSEACVTEQTRRRFTLGRGMLRHVLALYTGRPAASLRLLRGETGKPSLAGETELHFSITHSRDTALIAVARAAVGVDLEHRREPARLERIARRVLHADTVALLAGLDAEARREAFLEAWTLREAHVKAVGGGLFRTPDTLPLPGGAIHGEPIVVQERDGTQLWSIVRLRPAPDLTAALVARGIVRTVAVRDAATAERLPTLTDSGRGARADDPSPEETP